MRAPLARLGCLLSLVISTSAAAVAMDWTPIGNLGNAADSTGFGAVGYAYNIGTYEVTNAQYAEFLNAKAGNDTLGLYDTRMGSAEFGCGYCGINRTRAVSSDPYTYTAISGRENMPVNYVSFYDSLRFANWLNNGQGNGDTETGAYTLLGGTATPSNGTTVTRNGGATIVLPSEDEWYKAAYYDAFSTSYFDYPAGSNTQTSCSSPTSAANHGNCNSAVGERTSQGSYTGSPSPYGTFDQGGNVWEWNESLISSPSPGVRGFRGGAFNSTPLSFAASFRPGDEGSRETFDNGFRVAMIPEPGTGVLVIAGLLGLGGWRRGRA